MGPADRLHLGKGIQTNETVFIITNSGHVWIDDYVLLGFHVKLLCGHHDYTLRGIERMPFPSEGFDIKIGKGAWLASGCIIIGPCNIGDNAVIGAGSVVTHDIPAEQLWAGNPARFIKDITFKT